MTNKASIYLTWAAISVGHVFISALAMPCSVLLPDAPRWWCCAMPWGLGMREQLHSRYGVAHKGVPGTLSAARSRLFHMSPIQKECRGLLYPFKTRPEEEARRLAALFVTLLAYKHAPIREEDSLEGARSGGFSVPSQGDEKGC